MANIREERKRMRIAKIRAFVSSAKKEKRKIDKEEIISWLIVEFAISRKIAVEEINAIMRYEGEDA